MQQVTHWLEKLRMSEYARRFADNDIALSILCDLAPRHSARHPRPRWQCSLDGVRSVQILFTPSSDPSLMPAWLGDPHGENNRVVSGGQKPRLTGRMAKQRTGPRGLVADA